MVLAMGMSLLGFTARVGGQAAGTPGPEVTTDTFPSPATRPAARGGPGGSRLALPAGASVAIIPVEGMIYDFVLDSLERRVERAIDDGATVIVIELDTYGGVVTSALEISKFLKDRTRVPVPTVAWVNNKAYSAGILIGAACDELIMANSSATGDCAPIVPGQELAPTERAKAFSPIATEFRSSAAQNGYTYATFHAMCVLGVELYLIEHPDTGERRLVNQAHYRIMVDGDRDLANRPVATPGSNPAPGSAPGTDPATPIPGPGGADPASPSDPPAAPPSTPQSPSPPLSPPSTPSIPGLPSSPPASGTVSPATATLNELLFPADYTDADIGRWVPVTTLPSGRSAPSGRIHDGGGLFTPDETLAADIGLSKTTVSTDAELMRYLKAASVKRVSQTWSERLAGFLTLPTVRGVLVLALLLGAYMEFQSPGLGFPGAVAAVALACLLGAPFVVGLAEIWHIIMFLIGFGLLIIELAFTPTFGLLGIVGLVMMLAGLVLAVVPSGGGGWPTPPPGVYDRLLASMVSTLLGLTLSLVGLVVLTRYYGSIPGLSRLVLADADAPISATQRPPGTLAPISGDESVGAGTIAVGDTGRVTSTGLRPTGRATLHGREVDVVSPGTFIDPGTPVRVVDVRGNTITVDAV